MLTRLAQTIARPVLTGGAFALLASVAVAQEGLTVRDPMVFIEAGIFCPREASGREEAPGTERGYIDLIDGELYADFHTNVVPGEIGLGFGIRFQLQEGLGARNVEIVTTHPPFGSPPVTVERYATTAYDDSPNASLFTFDYPYEVALGEWTIAVELDGEVVLSQTFTIIPPEDSIIHADMCDGPALMS
ncbi:DUF3859 domain-containing protein [Maritimibacter sp. UBA3975]|uniref:DUF3859 domain-containing protein n=1 Tax=Maritimibacter sp. UBA3975 TaxID=1946833 RepID=UPI000C0A58C3|nr:DUF3859 domain-containing protein [Maritimibacter sp. UBA3975]MAM61795.1 hypothetical protein [Maritimibacter sp.]|tara:strand:+ start:3921 stop:4487 length:567 start_codon:yes stop_codon:yes gene_type:complete